MTFKLHTELKNAAMLEEDETPSGLALAEILRDVAAQLEIGNFGGIIRDDNGNKVGAFGIKF